MTELSRFLGAVCLAGMMGGGLACVHPKPKPPEPTPTPTPVPTPTPTPTPDPSALPPKGQQARLDLLLRPAPGARLQTVSGAPVQWFQAIQCCGGADGTILPAGSNTRWPLASESWMDVAQSYGANAVHWRPGPFYSGDDYESEWNDIGGPYKVVTP